MCDTIIFLYIVPLTQSLHVLSSIFITDIFEGALFIDKSGPELCVRVTLLPRLECDTDTLFTVDVSDVKRSKVVGNVGKENNVVFS